MKRVLVSLLTGFGSGLIPVSPGTAGSVVSLVIGGAVFVLDPARFGLWMLVLAAASFLGCWLGFPIVRSEWGEEDPSQVVLDEFSGMFLGLWILGMSGHHGLLWWFVIFFLFRVFDMWKPFPIRSFESLGNSLGLVLDDIVAGGVAGGVMICYQIFLT